jgi:hypothetical protein
MSTAMFRLGGDPDEYPDHDSLPHHWIFDGLNFDGVPVSMGPETGIGLIVNAVDVAVMNGSMLGFKAGGKDTQAILGANGTRRLLVHNMDLEASGEIIMFGGAASGGPEMTPEDILIHKCRMNRGQYMIDDVREDGRFKWAIKNIFELKDGIRVHVHGCEMKNNPAYAQHGYAIVLTPRGGPPVYDENGQVINLEEGVRLQKNPYCQVRDVLIEHIRGENWGQGINLMGGDTNGLGWYGEQIQLSQNIVFHNWEVNNLGAYGNRTARLLQLLVQNRYITLDGLTMRKVPRTPETAEDYYNWLVFDPKDVLQTPLGNWKLGGKWSGPANRNFVMRNVSGDIGKYGHVGGSSEPNSGPADAIRQKIDNNLPGALFEKLHYHSPNGREWRYEEPWLAAAMDFYDEPADLPAVHDEAALVEALTV